MSEKLYEKPPLLFDDLYEEPPLGEILGEDVKQLGEIFRPAEKQLSDEEFILSKRKQMSSPEINQRLMQIRNEVDLQKERTKWSHIASKGEFIYSRGGVLVKYLEDTIEKTRKKTGKSEAATFGRANFNGQECVLYAMNFDFMGGSVGAIAGQKFVKAIELAQKEKLPFVSLYSTGGMRQQENIAALVQMQCGVKSIVDFDRKSKEPHIAILLGQVWGGTSASTVPLADVVVGVAGSNFGFAGPRVIGAFEGTQPSEGSQSVEANYFKRFVDVVVQEDELVPYVSNYLRTGKTKDDNPKKKDRIPTHTQRVMWDYKHKQDRTRRIVIGEEGFAPTLFEDQYKQIIAKTLYEIPEREPVNIINPSAEDLFDNYEKIAKDPGRPDTEFFIKTVFEDATPLYNHYMRGNSIIYPAIIAAIAQKDNQPVLVIGNQPSYTVKTYNVRGEQQTRIVKHLSTPYPEDYERVELLMEMAQRRGLPVVTFTDTLGAAPTIESEQRGISRRLARTIKALVQHNKPVISYIIGGLGSGGGLALTSFAPQVHAEDISQAWVAEPTSWDAIVSGSDQVERQRIIDIMPGLRCTPQQIRDLGIPVRIVKTDINNIVTAKNISEDLSITIAEQDNMSEWRLHREKSKAFDLIGRVTLKNAT